MFDAQEDCSKRAVAIDAVDGGWIVRIHNPHPPGRGEEMAMSMVAQILPQINAISMGEAVREADDALEPYKRDEEEAEARRQKKIDSVMQSIKKTFAANRPVPPVTVHVFSDFGRMIDFVEKALSPGEGEKRYDPYDYTDCVCPAKGKGFPVHTPSCPASAETWERKHGR